jgi:hypothetical protein
MASIGGPNNFGLFTNGDFRQGTNNNFTFGTYQPTGGPNNGRYIRIIGGGGADGFSSLAIPVDTSQNYQLIVYAKTFTRGSANNSLAGGHIGFACYDKNGNFIDLRQLKGIGDTQLTRAASPGNTTIYVSNASGWSNDANSIFRNYMLFGGQYPYSGGYSRYTGIYNQNSIINLGGGEYSVTLSSGLPTWSDALVGGVYPVGTYFANGRAGGSYNYALGAPNYPETWTKYSTSIFTGESRNSDIPFRFGTKFVRFLILRNYNQRSVTQNHVWGIANIFFGKVLDGKNYSISI